MRVCHQLRGAIRTKSSFQIELPCRATLPPLRARRRSFHNGVSNDTRIFIPPHAPPINSSDPILCHEDSTGQDGTRSAEHEGTPQQDGVSEPVLSLGKTALPVSCPGCGALAQEVESAEAGFYTRSRKAVRTYLKSKRLTVIVSEATSTNEVILEDSTAAPEPASTVTSPDAVQLPVCDRCHDLLYNFRGVPIAHPSLEDIADSIAESPFSRNHVYHVLDAADFPMSLEPKILSRLSLARPRSQNRRSQQVYPHKPTLSFLITRSDLLAPTKEKVDRMMSYFQTVLRTALGRQGENLRLGNVHLVSSKRGWWTTEIKDDIWKRGGGNWLVGKFNVGKSNLFEVLFPKGSGERAPSYQQLVKQQAATSPPPQPELLSEMSLLPPPQPEAPFPSMPLVSSLPGTTASPIRLPFGNHRGELIDLPGLERSNLDKYVKADHKLDLVMTGRPKVYQHTIKPGQSLLLGGGLVRITPLLDPEDDSTTMQAFPFVPLEAHVTATEKAIGTQDQTRESGIGSILSKSVGNKFKSAGTFNLDTDVTKKHAGPLIRASVAMDRLPFRIYSTDILIQGVGWVELVCQVRTRRRSAVTPPQSSAPSRPIVDEASDHSIIIPTTSVEEGRTTFKPFAAPLAPSNPPTQPFRSTQANLFGENTPSSSSSTPEQPFPQVEVFTPQGKHISNRIPLGAWMLWKEGGGKIRGPATSRPRRSMKGVKAVERERSKTGEGGLKVKRLG